MNLSSHLQMPSAPLSSNSPNNTVPPGPRSGVGMSAAASSGFDFSLVMAKQIERIASQERQSFAADAPAVTNATTPQKQDSHASDRKSATARDTSSNETSETVDERDHEPRNSKTSRGTSKRTPTKPDQPDVNVLLEGLMQGQSTVANASPATSPAHLTIEAPQSIENADVKVDADPVSATPLAAPTLPVASAVAPEAPAAVLRSMQISPHVRILTAPQPATTQDSLMAFAKAMGLDEAAIKDLMAQQPPSANALNPLTAETKLSPLNVATQTLITQGQGLSANTQAQTSSGDDMVAVQLAAMNHASAQSSSTVSGAGLAAPASTLNISVPGLTATDMAAITQVQITVLPAAVLPMNTPSNVPSTLDMLSLMDTGGITEQDVDTLLTRFSEESGQENNAEQQASPDDSQHSTGFAQTLARQSTAAAAPSVTGTASTTNMSEVYDQLSDKMATEMAARMHKQLSDGQWKMKFALRPSNLGGVEIQLEMKDGQLNAAFQADNPLTRDLLQNSSQRLREALANFGINAGQVNVGQGGGNTTHNGSGNSGKQPQVRDNSSSQVNGSSSATSAATSRNKANASLLDLYA